MKASFWRGSFCRLAMCENQAYVVTICTSELLLKFGFLEAPSSLNKSGSRSMISAPLHSHYYLFWLSPTKPHLLLRWLGKNKTLNFVFAENRRWGRQMHLSLWKYPDANLLEYNYRSCMYVCRGEYFVLFVTPPSPGHPQQSSPGSSPSEQLAGSNGDVRVSEAAHVGQVSDLCIQTVTQLDDGICIRGGSVCVVGNGSQLHSDFACYLYGEPYSGFISSLTPSYFYLILTSNVCCLLINIVFCYIFICWKIGGFYLYGQRPERKMVIL